MVASQSARFWLIWDTLVYVSTHLNADMLFQYFIITGVPIALCGRYGIDDGWVWRWSRLHDYPTITIFMQGCIIHLHRLQCARQWSKVIDMLGESILCKKGEMINGRNQEIKPCKPFLQRRQHLHSNNPEWNYYWCLYSVWGSNPRLAHFPIHPCAWWRFYKVRILLAFGGTLYF
jgi:hypothetical protein